MTTTATIRFADLDGMTVVTGPAAELEAALAHGSPIIVAGQPVTLIDEVEIMDDGSAVCDFAERKTVDIRQSRPRGRECVTGGNCSSHGDGRSCGGRGCDGYES
jgi:hypothetical protein